MYKFIFWWILFALWSIPGMFDTMDKLLAKTLRVQMEKRMRERE
jgi:hypothetical protein